MRAIAWIRYELLLHHHDQHREFAKGKLLPPSAHALDPHIDFVSRCVCI